MQPAANHSVPSSPGRYGVIGCELKQNANANEGCNSCASLAGLVLSFIACFILLVIAPLTILTRETENLPVLSEKFAGDFDRRVDVGEVVAESVEQIDVAGD